MITDKLTKNYKEKRRLFLFVMTTITILFISFSFISYYITKVNFIQNVDELLKSNANSIEFLLEDNFHDRAVEKNSISQKEDILNIRKLTKFANLSEVEYIYTMIKKDGKIYFTSSSATNEDYEKELVTRYFDEYESVNDQLKKAFESLDNSVIFDESIDKWGHFRSVFIPLTTENGNRYILGADIKIDYIDAEANRILIYYLTLFLIILGIIYFLYYKKTKLEAQELKNIEALQTELEDEIKAKTSELKSLNENLEERVKEEVEKNVKHEILLLKNSKYSSMGEMIDSIAHQWKQPLNIINIELGTTLKTIEYGISTQESILNSLKVSMEQIKHLSKTITQFRQFFKPDQVRKRVKVEDIVNNSTYLLKSVLISNNININIVAKEEIYAEIIEGDFIHVFINLINNSIDAFNENKIVHRDLNIEILKDNENVIINFQDNAGGISSDIINKIFKSNFTTKGDKGSGIGLYLTKMIIEKINGTIEAKSIQTKNGKGTLFTIKL